MHETCTTTGLGIPECSCEECIMRQLARRDVALIDAGVTPEVIVPRVRVGSPRDWDALRHALSQ